MIKQFAKKYVIIFPLIIICIALISVACLACDDKTDDEHTHSYIETVIDPTCTESGYTLHECSCGESYTDAFVPAIGHTPKAAVQENVVPAGCTTDGSYDEVVYCDVCNEKLSSVHKTIEKLGHTPKAAVQENVVPAGCTTDGSYDEVVYCDVCNEKLSSVHKTIEKLGHTPKAAVQENVVPAGCTTDGSYDEVVYCDVCNEKLSSEHKIIEKLGHQYKDGICSVCGEPELGYNIEDLQFTLSQDESYYIVSGFNGEPTYANIPYTYLDKPVTSIGDSAFKTCTTLTSVLMPNSITSIGASAFEGCTALTSVTMSSGLISIGKSAFYHCTDLTSATIPEGVTSIGQYAFEGCLALTSVNVPNSLVSIGSYAFEGCTRIIGIYYAGTVEEFCKITGIGNLMGWPAYKELYLNGEQVIDLVIPDSVTSIASDTFFNCIGIKSITVGKGVTTIGEHAFYGCTSLETVYWNATACKGGWFTETSNTAIISHIFAACDNLTTVVIGENVLSIPAYLLYQCRGLTSITIPGSVTTIGNYAFEYCTSLDTVYWNATACTGGWFDDGVKRIFYSCDNLTTVVIGENVRSIPDYVFGYCSNITSVTIPDNVTAIGNYSFYDCTGLESVTIGKGVATIGKSAFYGCTSLEIVYWNAIDCTGSYVDGSSVYAVFKNCNNLKTFAIGDGVDSLPDYLLYTVTSVEVVIVPESLTYIGKSVFYHCSNLSTIYYRGTGDVTLSTGSGNTYFNNAQWYYYSED